MPSAKGSASAGARLGDQPHAVAFDRPFEALDQNIERVLRLSGRRSRVLRADIRFGLRRRQLVNLEAARPAHRRLASQLGQAARRARKRVPDDVSVVGYDDSLFMTCTDPPLTTVRQPIEAMGQAVVALLVNGISGNEVPGEELLFEPELVVRGSTGPASAASEPQPRAARA